MILTSSFGVVLIVLVLLVQRAELSDPLKRFCRRFGHATTVIDHRLYIDGGLLNYHPISINSPNYTSKTESKDIMAQFANGVIK